MIENVIIKLLNKMKYLEIIFDKELQFKIYFQYIITKDIKVIMRLSSIAKNNWEI